MGRYSYLIGVTFVSGSWSSMTLAQEGSMSRLEIGFELDVRHDTNIANASAERAAARGLEQDDQRLGMATTVDFERAFGPNSIYADAYLGYDFHAQNEQLDSERISAQAGGSFRAAFCDLLPEVSFSRQQSVLGSELISINDVSSVDNIETVQRYGAGVSCGGEIGVRVEAGVSYERGDNDNELREIADYETITFSGGLGYEHPALGTFALFASHQETDFENRVLDGVEDGFEAQRFGARFERDIGARISGSVEAFYITTDSTFNTVGDFDGVGFAVSLRALLTEQLQASVNLARDIETPLNTDALFSKATSYGANLEYAAGERLTVNFGYNFSDRDFIISELAAPTPFNLLQQDRVHTFSASANYEASERLSFTLYGGYESRDADPDFFDYDGGFVGLTARFRFGRSR